MKTTITVLAFAGALATAACMGGQQGSQGGGTGSGASGGAPNVAYGNDKAGGGNTGAPGHSQPTGN